MNQYLTDSIQNMNMEKFYKPDIDEFFVGCEYYIFSEYHEKMHGTPYAKFTIESLVDYINNFDLEFDENNLIKKINVPDFVKMRHIDEDDIKELGFKRNALFTLNNLDVYYNNKCQLRCQKKDGYIDGIDIRLYKMGFTFYGKLKNKLALKKVLMQLQVL